MLWREKWLKSSFLLVLISSRSALDRDLFVPPERKRLVHFDIWLFDWCFQLVFNVGSWISTTKRCFGGNYSILHKWKITHSFSFLIGHHSLVFKCAAAAHGLKGHIISDGGCTCPGDICKAFGAEADFVMLGGLLAGHDQSGGETIEKDGKKVKLFYGMSSATAMTKHVGGVAEYRASEGKTVRVPYRGDVNATILDILGGLRSASTYVGAATLAEFSRRASFIRVSQQTNEIFASNEV